MFSVSIAGTAFFKSRRQSRATTKAAVIMFTKPSNFDFELKSVLSSIVTLRVQVPENAQSAATLGSEREGHGVHIGGGGLILTVSYLITEASTVWIIDAYGRATQGHLLASDSETGFGLVKAQSDLDIPAIALGKSAEVKEGESVLVAGHGIEDQIIVATVFAKREFAGPWEYLLEEGIFTSPPHPNWGGAAVINHEGNLIGIGSLFVQEMGLTNKTVDGNMIIPIDLLKPILDDLIKHGRTTKPARPWIGISTADAESKLIIARVNKDGPAAEAGLKVGDAILEVSGDHVADLPSMYRSIWGLGSAGVDVPFRIMRDETIHDITVHSVERRLRVKPTTLH